MKFKMAAMTGLTGTFGHRKAVVLVTQSFFLESTNMIKPKLYINGQLWSLIKLAFIYGSEITDGCQLRTV